MHSQCLVVPDLGETVLVESTLGEDLVLVFGLEGVDVLQDEHAVEDVDTLALLVFAQKEGLGDGEVVLNFEHEGEFLFILYSRY